VGAAGLPSAPAVLAAHARAAGPAPLARYPGVYKALLVLADAHRGGGVSTGLLRATAAAAAGVAVTWNAVAQLVLHVAGQPLTPLEGSTDTETAADALRTLASAAGVPSAFSAAARGLLESLGSEDAVAAAAPDAWPLAELEAALVTAHHTHDGPSGSARHVGAALAALAQAAPLALRMNPLDAVPPTLGKPRA
jgi:hypothetical protein